MSDNGLWSCQRKQVVFGMEQTGKKDHAEDGQIVIIIVKFFYKSYHTQL